MGTTTWTRGAAMRVQGSHVFEISGYSRHPELLGAFPSVQSAVFAIGGYDWQIQFYPKGLSEAFDLKDYLAIFVSLQSKNNDIRVRGSVQFSLMDVTGSSPPHTMTSKFDPSTCSIRSSGHCKFKKRSELEGSPYLRDDRLTIECVITLDKAESLVQPSAQVPPSDIIQHLRELLRLKEGADVTFEVRGEPFPAHKTVLAMRSPVFKAELYGAMREKDMTQITILDMQPTVFEALLHFIYTDSLPARGDDLGCDDYEETIRHLLVAADRYAMDRLKMICENILRSNIDVKTVMTTLVLADQHHCGRLTDDCIQFIASLGRTEMDDMMASRGYAEVKGTNPLAIVELWEKIHRLYKSKSSFHIGSSAT